MNTCNNNVNECILPTITKFQPPGTTTVWKNNCEISSGIAETIRNSANTNELREYMQAKYNWNDTTIDSIDWMIQAAALKRLRPSQQKTTIQLIHEWLPVNGHPGRQQPTLLQHCPHCNRQIETQTHFLTCDDTSTTWTTQLTKTINDAFPEDSQSPLRNILIWALTLCRTNNEPFPFHDNVTQFTLLIREQSDIGWNQVLKGRWSKEWVQHLEIELPSKGEQQAINLLHGIWTTTLKLWNERCEQQHKHHETETQHQRQALTQQVLAIYDQKPNLDIVDQQPLTQSIEPIQ
jgi:hypothetical protein